MVVDRRLDVAAVEQFHRLAHQFLHRTPAAVGYRGAGDHLDALQTDGIVDDFERDQQLHGVGAGRGDHAAIDENPRSPRD